MLTGSMVKSLVDVVFRPEAFLRSQPDAYNEGWREKGRVVVRSIVRLVVNLFLFAVPLTVAFSGVTEIGPFSGFGVVIYPFVLLTFVTVWAFHAAVILTRNTRGLITSFQTVTNTAGIYLSLAMGFAFPVLVAPGAVGEFFRGATLYLFIFTGDTVTAESPGQVTIILAVVAGCYYVYSLYVSARVRHGATRFEALIMMVLSLSPTVLIFPWLASPQESGLPPLFYSDMLLVTGAVLGAVSVIALSIDLLKTSIK